MSGDKDMVVAEGLRTARESLKRAIEKASRLFSADLRGASKEEDETVSSLWKALKELESEIANMEENWEEVLELVSDRSDK
jgi:hypothetical protein